MARTRSEDRLDRAMDVFWQRGYYDTSIEELMSRTGLHRAAVYGSFRSKRGLFEATLRRYQEKVVAAFVAPIARPDATLADIDQFFRGIHDAAAQSDKRWGCLMINTASEVSPHIRSVERIVSLYLANLRGFFHRASVNARTRGDFRSETDVDQVADYLTGAVLGLWTLGRCPVPALALSHYLQGVRGYLDSLRPGSKRRGPSGSRADRAS